MRLTRRTLIGLALGACLSLGSIAVQAAAAPPIEVARDVTVKINLLANETVMMVYDEAAQEYRDRARARVQEVRGPVAALVADLGKQDAPRAAALAEQWRLAEGALVGGGDFGDGMIKTGYDTRVHGEFDTNTQKILAEIERLYQLRAPAAPVEVRTHVLVARVVSSYIKIAGSPFGSYTDSFNTEDSDLDGQVKRVDAALAELTGKYKGDKEKSAKIRRLNAKWQFIRTTIVKASSQSTPFIVYKHGGDIVRDLGEFR